jgi:hypothetical protein
VRSEQAFCEQLDYNLLFRWFLSMTTVEPSFDPSTFAKNRQRLLEHDVARQFFAAVVRQADRDPASSTAWDYQAFLRSVTYSTRTDISPSASSTVGFMVNDGIVQRQFGHQSHRHRASHPAWSPSTAGDHHGRRHRLHPGQPPVVVDSGVAVASPSGAPLVLGAVVVSAYSHAVIGFQPGDVLGFTAVGALTGSYNPAKGVLSVRGTGSAADYQAFFQSVTYTSGTNPDPGTARTFEFLVSDTVVDSDSATKDLTITLHSAPVLAGVSAKLTLPCCVTCIMPTYTRGSRVLCKTAHYS